MPETAPAATRPTAPPTPAGVEARRSAAARCRWWPVPFVRTLAGGGSLPFRNRALLFGVGGLFTVVCILSSLAMVRLDWNGLPLAIGPLHFYVTIYPPLVLCTLALFWLGLPWAFIPAYLATLVGALGGGMDPLWALLFALADPLGLAVYALAYRAAPLRFDLRTPASFFWYVAFSAGAALAGSSGSFIWAHTRAFGPLETFALWEGWWIGALLQSLFIAAPVLALASPRVVAWRDRWIADPPRSRASVGWLIGIAVASTAIVAMFIWTSGRMAREHMASSIRASVSPEVAERVRDAVSSLDLLVLHCLALLVVVALGGVLLAISWNRALQKEVESRTAELTESEERYALAAQAANDGLWDWNLATGRIYFSPRWRAMLGRSTSELGDGLAAWLDCVHPDDRESMRAALEAHVAGHTSHFEGEYRLRHRDGTDRWMLVRGLAVRDPAGRPTRVAGSQTDVTERKSAEEQLVHDALHDQLTGLPNRVLFLDRLANALSRTQRNADYLFAVLFLDLDRFKVINDSLGHAAGDRVLVAVGDRLARCLRPGDTVARLGGDEFAILLDDIHSVEQASEAARRIHTELAMPLDLADNEVFTTASIGIATSRTGYSKPEDVLRDADTAMYRAKNLGKARHQVFDTGMHARAMKLLLLESDLRRAVEQRSFELRFQPIVALADDALSGFESLLRWTHPTRGAVPIEEYLPLAEETGLIAPLGWWVLEEACRRLVEWTRSHPWIAGITMSVNLSARQLAQSELAERVERALAISGLAPARLRLEVTESAIIDHTEIASGTLAALKRLGVGLDLDDFGTGYSSLSYLHRLPIDRVKIDRSFVRGMLEAADSMEIVRAIVGLAHGLGLEVVAEGIEDAAQAATLRSLDCPLGQGFYFAPALSESDVRSRLARGARWTIAPRPPSDPPPSIEPSPTS